MNETPLPCPFCGSKPYVDKTSGDERNGYDDRVTISCMCGASMKAEGDTSRGGYADNSRVLSTVMKKWNTRTFVS